MIVFNAAFKDTDIGVRNAALKATAAFLSNIEDEELVL